MRKVLSALLTLLLLLQALPARADDLPRFARVGCINTPWENEFWQPGER